MYIVAHLHVLAVGKFSRKKVIWKDIRIPNLSKNVFFAVKSITFFEVTHSIWKIILCQQHTHVTGVVNVTHQNFYLSCIPKINMKEIIHAQTFSHHPNLKRHERTHHGVKAKSGNNFGIFDEPMKTAEPKKTKSSPKMSSCNHCPKSYSTPYLLKYHIRKKHLLETESERAVHQGSLPLL